MNIGIRKISVENAELEWLLCIAADNLPEEAKQAGKRTFRSLMIDGESVEFSDGFTELHNLSYEQILNGKGFPLSETRKAIQLVHDIRNADIK